MDAEPVRIEYITIPGDQITEKQMREWCKLPSVYIVHRWGHLCAKLTPASVSFKKGYRLYNIFLQGAEGHAGLLGITRENIQEVVYTDCIGPQPYYILLKKD